MRPPRALWSALALVAASAPAAARQSAATGARFHFVDPAGSTLPPELFVVRDAQGHELSPTGGLAPGQLAFRDAGRKITVEFTRKGLKSPGLEIVLEDAPTVWVTLVVDPATGRVKHVSQKAQRVPGEPSGKSGKRGRLGAGLSGVAPVNDDCTSALAIQDGVTAFSTLGATTDGAPDPGGQYDGQTYEDVWFLYAPTRDGTLTASTCGTAAYDTDLVLYEADADGDGDHDADDCARITAGLEPVLDSNDDSGQCAGSTSVVSATVSAGRQYLVRVGGFGEGDEATGELSLTVGGPPANDACAGALALACGATTEATNVAATADDGDPEFGCAFLGPLQGDGTLWYRFTAQATSAHLSTAASVGVSDTLLAVYAGGCEEPIELACDDDGGPGLLSELCVGGLTVGGEYLVQVASYPGADRGQIALALECPGPCEVPCDGALARANGKAPKGFRGGGATPAAALQACALPCGGEITVDNTNALTDPLDPAFSCRFGGPGQGAGSVWFAFVATAGSAKLDTNLSQAPDTLLAVYEGTPGALTELACSDDEGIGLLSELCVEGLTAGATYFVQAASFSSFDTGEITVRLECPCEPGLSNDGCESALPLALPVSVVADLTDATDDVSVPCAVFSGPFRNVWYEVTGTGGTLTASTCNAGTKVTDTKIAVYCADCGTRVCVGGNDDDCASGGPEFASTASWCSQAGARYLVTVGTFSAFSAPGVVQLDVFESGGACAATVQCLATGACCLGDGTCVQATADECATAGGTYQGDGSSCTTDSVADGGFEGGVPNPSWEEASTNFGSPVCDPLSCGFGGGTGPRSGDFWLWFGGVPAFEAGSVEQELVIPAEATTLDFYLENPVSSGNGVDFLRVKIDGTTVFEVLEGEAPYAGLGYEPVSIPLAGFADGGSHTLRIEATQTGAPGITNFFVDDVSLAVQTADCSPCVTLDFATGDDFTTPLGNGQKVDLEFGELVIVSSAGNNAGPAIFDSSPVGPNGVSQDRDLLVNRGNLLILQTNAPTNPAPVGGVFPRPNDDEDGGELRFDFVRPSAPASVVLVDIDGGAAQASSVTLTDGAGRTRTYTVPQRWTEDLLADGGSAWRTLDLTTLAPQPGFASVATAVEDAGFDASDVTGLVVRLGSSGAVDDLVLCR